MILNYILKIFGILLVLSGLWICGCDNKNSNQDFIQTKFLSDTTNLKLRQVVKNINGDDFVAIFFQESSMSFGSGNKLMKLYSKDSLSIDECYFGAHPLGVTNWTDSTIIIKCSVSSAHGNSAYRKWYLDNSIDKNERIGKYQLIYMKNY